MFAHERPPIERAALQLSGVMRRLVPSLLGALAATAIVSAAGTPVSLREVRQSLFGTCFPTERDGWMVGELGRIFHTGDGGGTWERQDAGTKRPFLAIACLDARTAWIAGKEGIVYGTTDGGASWIPATTGSTRHVFGLAFANPERGHGVGDYGTIHTEDAGRHWTVSQVPPDVVLPESALDTGVDPGDVNLYAASYGDPDHLWVAGEFGTIMASDDGGRTFHQQHAPVESTLFGIHFADARRGWAVGIDAVILHTEDGGATWQMQAPPVRQQSFYDVFVRAPYGWIVGSAGTVLRSTDGGATWTAEPVPIELAANWIRSVWIAPGGHGFAVGAEGLVFGIDGAALRRLQGKGPTRAL